MSTPQLDKKYISRSYRIWIIEQINFTLSLSLCKLVFVDLNVVAQYI